MAKQDEVEPTDASDAAESSDATDELTAEQPGTTATALDEQDDRDVSPTGRRAEDADARRGRAGGRVRRNRAELRGRPVRRGAPDGEAHGPTDNGAAKVLEPAGVAATRRGTAPAARGRAPARTPKTAATAKRDQPAKPERTTPLKFVRQSIGELRKVVYPTGQQLINYFIVVLVFVLFVIAYVSLLDLGFGAAIFRIFS